MSKTWSNLIKYAISGEFDENIVEKFMKGINRKTALYSSVLHMAVLGGNIHFIQYLINHGVNVNAMNMYGETPLHWCCKEGKLEILKLLIKNGADVELRDYDGNSIVHWAAEYNQSEILCELLKYNIKNIPNIHLQSPLDIARLNESYEAINILTLSNTKILPSSNCTHSTQNFHFYNIIKTA